MVGVMRSWVREQQSRDIILSRMVNSPTQEERAILYSTAKAPASSVRFRNVSAQGSSEQGKVSE
jgi:hypothetical protein